MYRVFNLSLYPNTPLEKVLFWVDLLGLGSTKRRYLEPVATVDRPFFIRSWPHIQKDVFC